MSIQSEAEKQSAVQALAERYFDVNAGQNRLEVRAMLIVDISFCSHLTVILTCR